MNIVRTVSSDHLCTLTFDRAGSAANIFDRATLNELNEHLAFLEREPAVRGVILATAKPRIFIAGADLNAFADPVGSGAASPRPANAAQAPATPSRERRLSDMVNLGHAIFSRLARLPIPSVAAIHGSCLGGGLEVALACDWRVASTDKATKLGLPETQLGIIPAWGGSTRLPRLIGLPAALDLILTGKQLAGAKALKAHIVDDLAHPEYLLEAATKLLARGKRPKKAPPLTNRILFSTLIAAKARREVRAKTRGHYPAPLKAIDVCEVAARSSEAEGLGAEKAAFLELVRTPECQNLMSVFFLQERAKKLQIPPLSRPGASEPAVSSPLAPPAENQRASDHASSPKRVAVIGAGTMGAGIAQWVSARGYPVRLKDVNPEALARGMHAIEKIYADATKRRVFTLAEATAGLDRVTPLHTDVPLHDFDFVIEAAVEQLEVKQALFRELEQRVGPNTVLATNTSALSIDRIAAGLARPERVVGMHFFNPVQRMQLVEIVRGPRTSLQALDTALQFTKALGKLPVIARDRPGFLVNRILLPYLVEAVWLFAQGTPAAEIDRTMLDFGMPMGPLRLCDEVGLDVARHVAKDLERRLPHAVPLNDTLEKMIAKGWLGKKSGRGFYLHDAGGKAGREMPNPETRFLQMETRAGSDPETRRDRMVLIMVNEAARVLAEGVVDSPEDVDFGMIMGTGWAPFRGGPCRYADAQGLAAVTRRLELLAREVAPHFRACDPLREMAELGRDFYSSHAEPVRPAPRAGLSSHMDTLLRAANPSRGQPTPPAESRPSRATAAVK